MNSEFVKQRMDELCDRFPSFGRALLAEFALAGASMMANTTSHEQHEILRALRTVSNGGDL